VDRARALLAAGLFSEAAIELGKAISLFGHKAVAGRDRAEAELFRAHVAIAAGDWSAARDWARRARRRFQVQGNDTWAAVATLVRLQADFHQRRALAATAERAKHLAGELRTLGLGNDADAAALLSARSYGALGRRDDAVAAMRRCRPTPSAENRVQRRLVLAELTAKSGDRRGVLRHCRLGLAAVGRQQSRFGSVDLRTATAALGVELAGLGLAAALARGSPAQVFSWLELSREQSFRVRPVRPPEDREITDAVAELRYLAMAIRKAELSGERDAAARRRCAELERTIRTRGWHAGGDGRQRRPPRYGDLVAEAVTRLHHDLDALCD